jgi:hypothetical protein
MRQQRCGRRRTEGRRRSWWRSSRRMAALQLAMPGGCAGGKTRWDLRVTRAGFIGTEGESRAGYEPRVTCRIYRDVEA